MAHDHAHSPAHSTRRALLVALVLNGAFLIVELVAGLLTGSLALLSDATHMVSDVAAIALALGAAQLARRGATPQRSYGLLRAETLGAFCNGLALIVACAVIFWHAVGRLAGGSPHIDAWPVLLIGVAGLLVNLGSAWFLYRSDRENLNIRGALLHMLADALGSAGAIVAAGLLALGIYAADAVVSMLIGVLVLWATWDLLRDSARVLLQFAPPGVDVEAIRGALLGVEGTVDVHDLHVWSLDGQHAILSAHVVGAEGTSVEHLRERAEQVLEADFQIRHSTIQTEVAGGCTDHECPLMVQRTGASHVH